MAETVDTQALAGAPGMIVWLRPLLDEAATRQKTH